MNRFFSTSKCTPRILFTPSAVFLAAVRRYQRLLGHDPAADAEDELETHLALRVDDLMRQGHSEAEAHSGRSEVSQGNIAATGTSSPGEATGCNTPLRPCLRTSR